MSRFRGSFVHVVDDKGRVNFPSKLKKHVSPEANETFIITRGFETCLFIYPLDEWNKYESRLEELNSHEPDNRFFTRELLEYVTECTLDKQSRLIITQDLRDYAAIREQVLIIGQIERVELWNPSTYAEYKRGHQVSYAEIAAKVLTTAKK
jgi:MraZ protein